MRRVLERLMNLFRLRRADRDLGREIDAHLAMLQETYEAQGLSPEAARRAARLAFGHVGHVKEKHLDARSFRVIEDAWQDAGHGLRLLRRSPVFTATAALSLAIGIGANTAIFTVANALLFRPPTGVVKPTDLVVIGTTRGDGGLNPLNYATYLEISQRSTTLTNVFAEAMFPNVMGLVASGTERAEAVLGRYVSANFFAALGSPPFRGRVFAQGDDSTALLDYDYWRRRFNSDDGVIGRVLRINGRPVTIVGVTAPDFRGTGIQQCDVWLAIASGSSSAGLMAGGRVRYGVSFDTAVAEVKTIGDTLNRLRGTSGERIRGLNALPFSRVGGNRNIVFGFAGALMVLVSLVLAVACANVASVMLARATARAREIALRAALGAGRGRLARQLLTEMAVLFLISGVLGLGLARVFTSAVTLILPPMPASIVVPLTLDWRVLLFAFALSIAAAVVFGVLPASRGSKVDAGASLKDGVRSSSGSSRLRSAFVVGQISCSVLLVVLTATFVRALRHAGADDPGFDARGVDVATLDLSVIGEPSGGPLAFWRTVLERVRQSPAVEHATLARVPPGGWEGIGLGGIAPGDRSAPTESFTPAWNIVDTNYFATLRIPILAGRDFAPADTTGAPSVAIVSETLAQRIWPGQPAIGKTVTVPISDARGQGAKLHVLSVVGIAANIRSSSLIDGLA